MEAILQIKQNIASNKSDKAVQDILYLLKNNKDSAVYNEALNLSSRYIDLRQQEQLNLIDEYFSATEKNRLIHQLLQLVESIAKENLKSKPIKKENIFQGAVNFFRGIAIFLGFTKI